MQPGATGSASPAATPPRRLASSRWARRAPPPAAFAAVVYAVVAFAWIAFSDRLLLALIPDPVQRAGAETLKGGFFVVVTSVLLYELIRRGEAGVRSLAAEVRATFDSLSEGVMLVDSAANVVESNHAAAELLAVRSRDELLGPVGEVWGRRFDVRYPDGSPVPVERYASSRALRGERVPPYDVILRRRDGRELYASISAAPVDGTGLVVVLFRDVSAARRLDEVRDEFLETAAHELKTPLAVIKAYAQLVQKREPAESQPLAAIERQVDRLDRLVHCLLDTSRLRLESDSRRERVDLGALAAEVVERIRRGAPRHTFTVDAPAPAPVEVERARLARVIAGLVDNAVRFSPAGGPVEVHVEARADEAVLSVRDHGVGIAPERQARVFERYSHPHAGTPDDSAGLGLGLEVSRAIVERHGGRMSFESTLDRGSTFFVVLPLAARGAA